MNRLPGFVAETSLKPSGSAYRGAAGRAILGATVVGARIAGRTTYGCGWIGTQLVVLPVLAVGRKPHLLPA